MQQWLEFGRDVPIAGLKVITDVRNETGPGGYGAAKGFELVRVEREPAEGDAGGQHQDQCGKNPVDAANIEVAQAERSASQPGEQYACDQVSRDDEEDVDADEPVLHLRRER